MLAYKRQPMKMSEFIEKFNLSMRTTEVDEDLWKCVLHRPGKRMTVYMKGYPSINDVLCKVSDDTAYIDQSVDFEDWCFLNGYKPSKRTRILYRNHQKQAEKLFNFLSLEIGPGGYVDPFNILIMEVEDD